jgi:putative nucleotide binding protein
MSEKLIVLEILESGHPADPRPLHLRDPLVQVISEDNLVLREIIPTQAWKPTLHETVYRDDAVKIRRLVDRLENGRRVETIEYFKLTNTAKKELENVISEIVNRNEKRFVDFFNNAGPLTTRQHSLELLPGIGKKHMWEILDRRREKPFESFADIQVRIKLLSDPRKAVIKRVLQEIEGTEKYYLFAQPPLSKIMERWR